MAEIPLVEQVAGELDIIIEQGATFDLPSSWKDETDTLIVGLENWTARLQVRKKVADTEVLLEMTTENSRIILGANVGEIKLFLTASETEAIDWKKGVYHLELQNPAGFVIRLLEGTITISPEVTR